MFPKSDVVKISIPKIKAGEQWKDNILAYLGMLISHKLTL